MSNFYNKFLEKLILPLGDILSGSDVMKYLRYWRNTCKLSEKDIAFLAERNLKELLKFATKRVPFYNKINPEYNEDPYLWLRNFPVMRKQDIKNNLDELLTEPRENLMKFSSSGSSGIQGTTYQSKKELSANRAIQILWWEWAGFYPGKKIVQTGMDYKRSQLKRIKDFLFRTRYIHAFKSQENEYSSLLSKIEDKRGYHLGGYASSLNVLAEVAKKRNIKNVRFDAAISWGDKLFDKYKRNIYEAFGCKVYETYGCAEGFLVAAKKDIDYFYIMSPHVYVEIVDENYDPVPDGEMGYILLTRLDNRSMPLIRYYIGDLGVKLPKSKYPINKEMNFPLLERIIGRDTDIVRTPSGKYMIVHAFTGIFEYIPEIIQFRVIQKTIENIIIEYIPDSKIFHAAVLKRIEDSIHESLGEEFPIIWKSVDSIPPTPSGKPQIIQSFL